MYWSAWHKVKPWSLNFPIFPVSMPVKQADNRLWAIDDHYVCSIALSHIFTMSLMELFDSSEWNCFPHLLKYSSIISFSHLIDAMCGVFIPSIFPLWFPFGTKSHGWFSSHKVNSVLNFCQWILLRINCRKPPVLSKFVKNSCLTEMIWKIFCSMEFNTNYPCTKI